MSSGMLMHAQASVAKHQLRAKRAAICSAKAYDHSIRRCERPRVRLMKETVTAAQSMTSTALQQVDAAFVVARYWRAFCIALLVAASGARSEVVVWADPACPGQADSITVTAYSGPGGVITSSPSRKPWSER